ncbi:MAG: hypothetical protein J1F01_05560 [Oscillospiraceae bacterium]|nr:hypothetical protein [Oscillospiraceae bacterium]
MSILAIDPGNKESGWVIMDEETLEPISFGKHENKSLDVSICSISPSPYTAVVIERVACYGMPVGKEVFETCEWIGRFTEALESRGAEVHYITRKDEKLNLCNSMQAKDSNIRRALIDRFAQHDLKNGKGTKDNPDWFYGFKADIWVAYAVGVTWCDMQREV